MGRAFLNLGVVRPAIVATHIPVLGAHRWSPDLAQPADTFSTLHHRRSPSQHIVLSSLAIPPLGLPTGSKADASFEATGELSTWPLPFGDLALASWQKH